MVSWGMESERGQSRCERCPERAIIEKALGKLGLDVPRQGCPGPDVIDRFAVVALRNGEGDAPEGFTHVATISSMNTSERTDYYRGPVDRQKACPLEPIALSDDEIVTRAADNTSGRMWVRIGRGNEEDVRTVEMPPDLDGDDAPQAESPEEQLRTRRIVNRE